jgi:hypothetical protein
MTNAYQSWDFTKELNPQFLNYVCLLGGHAPPDLTSEFRYCQIGCGTGVTLNGLAAMYPDAQFTGIDGNADCIESAAALAADAELGNVQFLHQDLAELVGAEQPKFDYIALSDVYSLADPTIHDALLQFTGAHLAAGGVSFVNYHALPGFAALANLRDLVRHHTASLSHDDAAKAQAGVDYLTHLRDKKAGLFADNPALSAYLDEMIATDIGRLAHDLFAHPIAASHFHQVAGEMDGIGLGYSGSATLNLNFIDIAVPPDFHDLLRKSTTRTEFEMHGDAVRNQNYRCDVFTRDAPALDEAARDAKLAEIPFGTICDAGGFQRQLRFGEVDMNFDAEIFDKVIQAASDGAKSAAQMADMEGFGGYGAEIITDAIRFLSAGGQLLPFNAATSPPPTAALGADKFALPVRFNFAMLKQRLLKQPAIGFVSPTAGAGFEISMLDALLALCAAEAPANQLADHIFQRLIEARQQMIFEEGSETEAINAALIEFRAHRLGKFLELGFLAPA